MAFKEITKKEALEFFAFRCCICKDLAAEVHHIIPQSENGSDGLDNAAPLCSSCHDLFGGNPRKRKKLRALRNHWWTLIKAKSELAYGTGDLVYFEGISLDPSHRNLMKDKVARLYHVVYENEFFTEAASQIFELIQHAQVQKPFYDRILH
ncbi:MAG: HNH endonuclease signature motif containing protein [Cytophagales bacterium]|nr:HNH endonuclease signature motif containing protein [Cytophagales bacterium]